MRQAFILSSYPGDIITIRTLHSQTRDELKDELTSSISQVMLLELERIPSSTMFAISSESEYTEVRTSIFESVVNNNGCVGVGERKSGNFCFSFKFFSSNDLSAAMFTIGLRGSKFVESIRLINPSFVPFIIAP